MNKITKTERQDKKHETSEEKAQKDQFEVSVKKIRVRSSVKAGLNACIDSTWCC